MVPFKSCFMHDLQILNFYLANQEIPPFFEDFDGLRPIKKLYNTKCSKNLILWGVASIKNNPNFDF